MSASLAFGALLLGFLGSAHCVAMCGGFARAAPGIALHAGRIASYATAGALVGAAGAAPLALFADPTLQRVVFAAACAVLFVSGLRVGGFVPAGVAPTRVPAFERVAGAVARHVGPPSTGPRRFTLGVLWGWAPCGLVYAALPMALASGSPGAGALTMAAFGLGTLPALLGGGWVLARIAGDSRRWAGVLLMSLATVAFLSHDGAVALLCR